MKTHSRHAFRCFGLILLGAVIGLPTLTGCGQKAESKATVQDKKASRINDIQNDPTLTPEQKAKMLKQFEARQ